MKKIKLIIFSLFLLILLFFNININAISNTLNTNNNIYWIDGIKPLKQSDFIEDKYFGYTDYKTKFNPSYGYYDINKTENREGDNSLCFAVTASNALHWWLDINKDNIDKLFLDNPNYNKIDEINNYRIKPTTHYDSNIYKKYHREYFNRMTGYWPDILIDQFINGYYPKGEGGVNSESWDGPDLIQKGPDPKGGYFFNTFKEHKLTDRMYVNYNDLNNNLKTYINNKTLVLLTFRFGNTAHVITIWGVEYDLNNNLAAIYYTDSDDDKEVGMCRYKVVNRNGKAYLTNKDDNTSGSLVEAISILRSGEEYFNPPHIHEYNEPIWDLSDINNITATFTCKLDSSHNETIKANVETKITDSTCTTIGETYNIASVNFNNKTYISNKFNSSVIPLKEHIYSTWNILINPTCQTEGKKERHCINCNYKETEVIPKLEHTLIFKDKINPTCETNGMISHYQCNSCNKYFDIDKKTILTNITINSLGHNYSENPSWNLSDINNLTATFICLNDSNHKEILKANYKEFSINSTCQNKGKTYKIAYITFNNKTYNSEIFDIKEIPLLSHNFSEWYCTNKESCINDGLYYRNCLDCNLKETKIIQKLGHITDDIYHNSNDNHYKICLNCNDYLNIEKCYGGIATTSKKAICEVCNNEYGKLLENKENHHIIGDKIINIKENDELIIKLDSTNNIEEIIINNKIINKDLYVINNITNIIKFKKEIFNNLNLESNNIIINYSDGYATFNINVIKSNNINIIIISIISSISLIGLISLLLFKKYKH